MDACLALLRTFAADDPAPQITATNAAQAVADCLGETAMAYINDGQFAALIDLMIWKGVIWFAASEICGWVVAGNLAKPPKVMATMGHRGLAERDVWNIGNSA